MLEKICGSSPWGPFMNGELTDCFRHLAITGLFFVYLVFATLSTGFKRSGGSYALLSSNCNIERQPSPSKRRFANAIVLLSLFQTLIHLFSVLYWVVFHKSELHSLISLVGGLLLSIYVSSWVIISKTTCQDATWNCPVPIIGFFGLSLVMSFFDMPHMIRETLEYSIPATIQLVINFLLCVDAYFLNAKDFNDYMNPEDERRDSLEETADWLSITLFSWINPIIKLGYLRPLIDSDLWDLHRDDKSKEGCRVFREVQRPDRTLFMNLVFGVKMDLFWQFLFSVLHVVFMFVDPVVLKWFLDWVRIGDRSNWYVGLGYICLLFVGKLGVSWTYGQELFRGRKVGTRVRSIFVNEVYKKTLKRRINATGESTEGSDENKGSTGQITNLMSVDAQKICEFICYASLFLTCPLQIIVTLLLLMQYLGWSAFVGVGVLLIFTFVSPALMGLYTKFQGRTMEKMDLRISGINEVLNSIRIIKFFAWESIFKSKVNTLRSAELSCLKGLFVTDLSLEGVMGLMPIAITLSSFAVYIKVCGYELDASIAFTSLSLFNIISSAVDTMTYMTKTATDCRVSFVRISSYLEETDIQDYLIVKKDNSNRYIIGFDKASLSWEDGFKDNEQIVLENLSVQFPQGKVSVIMGATASGKSSLLLGLLGELCCIKGHVYFPLATKCNSTVAYVAQQAWIQNATIRDNILFGKPYDPVLYKQTVEACALKRDFEILDGGDMTEIGEKGINVSGGQKQRIALARAVYSQSDIILLDDPLSAVDAPTAKHLFENAILGPLLRGKTVLLVTHAVGLTFKRSDFAVILKNGTIAVYGTPEQIEERIKHIEGGDTLLGDHALLDDEEDEIEVENKSVSCSSLESKSVDDKNEDDKKTAKKLITEEGRAMGTLKMSVYRDYVKAIQSPMLVVGFFFVAIFARVVAVGKDYWLTMWSRSTELQGSDAHPQDYYIIGYMVISLSMVFVTVITNGLGYYASLRASKTLHSQLINRIMGAPISFFDKTPLGRITNRFSSDIQSVDQRAIFSLVHYVSFFFNVLSVLITVTLVTPIVFFVAIPIGYLYSKVASYYLSTSRELKRLESVNKSPIYSLFGEMIAGASTIRAYGHQTRFIEDSWKRTDNFHRPYYFLWVSNRWLSIRVELICAIITMVAGLGIILAGDRIDAALAGFVLNFVLSFTVSTMWLIRLHAELEMCMNSVERVFEYLEIEQEASAVIEGCRPPPNWPTKGELHVDNFSLTYSPDLDPVLKNLSFTVKAGEKVGIVGRTGAGKSTISLGLFRFIEAMSGRIFVDGIDISTIGLGDLRGSLTIIPQDPVLFTGTLRSNLDPTNIHSDEALFKVLRSVHLIGNADGHRTIHPDVAVQENGSNFSVGQRALICLARALLRDSKVIFIDEATASIDVRTDSLIQETIREMFTDSTVMCIAHRLRTVVDYDRVLVLDQGRIVEFDTPYNLITKTSTPETEYPAQGLFLDMCEKSGEFDVLFDIAKQKAFPLIQP